MLDRRCPTVYDVGPTLVQHWIDVTCVLGYYTISDGCRITTCLSDLDMYATTMTMRWMSSHPCNYIIMTCIRIQSLGDKVTFVDYIYLFTATIKFKGHVLNAICILQLLIRYMQIYVVSVEQVHCFIYVGHWLKWVHVTWIYLVKRFSRLLSALYCFPFER